MTSTRSPEEILDYATQKGLPGPPGVACAPCDANDFSVRQWALAQLNTLHALNVLPTISEADFMDVIRDCGETLKARGYTPKIACLSWAAGTGLRSLLDDDAGPFAEITALQPMTRRHQSHQERIDDHRAAWVIAYPQNMRATEMADLVQALERLDNPTGHPVILVSSETQGFRSSDLGGWVYKAVNAVHRRMEAELASLRLDAALPSSPAVEVAVQPKAPRM